MTDVLSNVMRASSIRYDDDLHRYDRSWRFEYSTPIVDIKFSMTKSSF